MKLPLPRVITLIGGGGKTSLMYYLVSVLKSLNMLTVATSTTKLANKKLPNHTFIEISCIEEGYQAVERARSLKQHVTLIQGEDNSNPEKLRGIPAEWIDKLAEQFPGLAIVVEGDGSAGRSLKGHLAHEPVIPATCSLVIPLIGIDALGAKLDAETVHRPERVSELTETPLGTVIDEELIVKLLFHPQGYLRNCLPEHLVIPFINKVETAASKQQAGGLANKILAHKSEKIQQVISGSIKQNRAQTINLTSGFGKKGISAVILAAGKASRMGQPKQLLPLGGKPMIWHVANQVCQAQLGEVLVVTGAYDEEIRQALADLPVKIVHNEDWAEGQATSVNKAVQSLDGSVQAVLFVLADQPLIDTKLINNLINIYQDNRAGIVIPRYQGRRGNPTLFDLNTWRTDLLNLTGDQGARSIILNNPRAINFVELASGHYFFDVDTPEEYQKMQLMWDGR